LLVDYGLDTLVPTGTSDVRSGQPRVFGGLLFLVCCLGLGFLLAGMIGLGHVCGYLFFYTVWVPWIQLPLYSGTALVDAFYYVLSLCTSICFSVAFLAIACLPAMPKTLSWLELLNDDFWIVLQ
jgi:hypothetical protein